MKFPFSRIFNLGHAYVAKVSIQLYLLGVVVLSYNTNASLCKNK